MKKLDPTVKRETLYILALTVAMSLVMQGVFAIFGAWNLSVLWGNLLGGAAAVINFLLMGITVQNVMGYEEKRLRNAVRLSQMLRMLLLIAVAALGVALPCFSTVAALVPLFFPRVAVALRPLFKLGGEK